MTLQPPSRTQGSVAIGATPDLSSGARTEEELDAIAKEAAATPDPSSGVSTPAPRFDFWGELFGVRDGPLDGSLTNVGERSEAVVMGSFTGEVEPGREACGEESIAAGAPREQACVSFANLPFRIHEILAGSLPGQFVESVKLEYQVDPGMQAALAGVVPTDARLVLFIGSASDEVRSLGWDVYHTVGRGTFRDADGRVVPAGWPDDMPDDPQFGRLEGLSFEQFVDLVRRVPILGATK